MREWIVTNGLGGYASLTQANTNTRKFHGLLVCSLHPPTQRWMYVSNIYDAVIIDQKRYWLHEMKGLFSFDGLPCFSYELPGVTVRKTILMPHDCNTTIIHYSITTNRSVTLRHLPHITSRHFYDVIGPDAFSIRQDINDRGIAIKSSNSENTLKMMLHDARYEPEETWHHYVYEKDRQRQDSYSDYSLQPGTFIKHLQGTTDYYLVLTIEQEIASDPAIYIKEERQRQQRLLQQADLPSDFEKLVHATDTFIVKKEQKKSIVAGYHWFGDWGRDTLIALPGLTLVTKRYEDAKNILLSFSNHCKKGLIPNVFMEKDSQPVYNTVDASLWYIDRVYQYMKYTNDRDFLQSIWPTLESIITSYQKGTLFDIHMDTDFLIHHGPGLTWMDVKLNDTYPTPRAHKAVEIQALWYNALRIMDLLSTMNGKPNPYGSLAANVKDSFLRCYTDYYDVIDNKDTSCRPNKIFLASLDFSMIEKPTQEAIVTDVHERLLTPFGLRSLSPDNPQYKGTYLGMYHRDLAYHNGTVWPWLLGAYIKASVKLHQQDSSWREHLYASIIQPLLSIYGERWDGAIQEIFDGDPPYEPRGCISQAWSVAEILRSWVEDIDNRRPPFEEHFLPHRKYASNTYC
jgi:predicted glycogen debranching enzyme